MKDEGGVVGLYKGLSPTLLGIAPYVGLNFAVYETLKGATKDCFSPVMSYPVNTQVLQHPTRTGTANFL